MNESAVVGSKIILEALKRAQHYELKEVAEFIAELSLSKFDGGRAARRISWLLTTENALSGKTVKYLWTDEKGEVSGTLLTEAQVIERAGKDHGYTCLLWSKTII